VRFTGFGEDAVEFYDGLAADNSKAYWTDRKAVYDAHVRDPMQALLDDVEPEFGAGKIFRPYRDLRFARDKTPYKDHCGATVAEFYVQVGPDGLMAAGGYYQMAGDQVARFRTAVDDDRRGKDLVERLAAVQRAGLLVAGETLRTRPRGFDPDHPRIDLLRHKGLYASRTWPPDDALHEPDARDRVVRAWRSVRPLVEWLRDHVGPTEQPRR
jgi:uncharacterized protein (TIGR02453 family)